MNVDLELVGGLLGRALEASDAPGVPVPENRSEEDLGPGRLPGCGPQTPDGSSFAIRSLRYRRSRK